MIKGYYINANGDVLGVEQGETVSINGLSVDDGYDDYEGFDPEGEDFSDQQDDDSFEDDYDFPWDENGQSFEEWLDEVL